MASKSTKGDDFKTCHVTTVGVQNEITKEGPHQPEAGRYHLFTAKLCPFAHRTEIVRRLKGLEDSIGLTIACSIQSETGWKLDNVYAAKDGEPNPVKDTKTVPDIYRLGTDNPPSRFSVPVFYDKKLNKVVNTESAEIIRMLNSSFNDVSKAPELDLYPESQRKDIDAFNDNIGSTFVSAIYRAGFAKDKDVYSKYYDSVFKALEDLDKRFSDGRKYVFGDKLTLADVYVFVHVIRFDSVYYGLYKLNEKHIHEYPNIRAYIERLWKIDAFSKSTDIKEAQIGYYLSWNQPSQIKVAPKSTSMGWLLG